MKKTLLFSLALASAASFAGDVESSNTFGLLEVNDTSTEYLLVSVPWNQFGTGSENVNIATIINPDQLADDASVRLYVAKDGGGYNIYKITDNAWVGCGTATIGTDGKVTPSESSTPAATTVKRGDAMWLKRSVTSNKPILIGQAVSDSSVSVSLVAGNNLVASPYTTAMCLGDIGSAEVGDRIEINSPSDSGTTTVYKYNKKVNSSEGWAYYDNVWKSAASITIPAGKGFWYISKSVKTITISDGQPQ